VHGISEFNSKVIEMPISPKGFLFSLHLLFVIGFSVSAPGIQGGKFANRKKIFLEKTHHRFRHQ
jgi:hypothetical protein